MASNIAQYRTARRALEAAIADVQDKAVQFGAGIGGWRLRELLAAGREYGRALNRVEKMRGVR